MYADDLITIAISVTDLKLLLQLSLISLNYFDSIDMPININKSKCTRFGKRSNNVCAPISVRVGIMQWNSEFRYLGVTVSAYNKLKSSFSESRRTFFGSFLMQFMEELEIKTISLQHCHY